MKTYEDAVKEIGELLKEHGVTPARMEAWKRRAWDGHGRHGFKEALWKWWAERKPIPFG